MDEKLSGKTMQTPKKLELSIGGFCRGYLDVCKDGKNSLVISYKPRKTEEKNIVKPSDTDWEIFYETLISIGISEWKSSYVDPYIMDGTQWKVKIEYDAFKIETYGSNAYPLNFDKFCEAVSNLIGKEFR